MMQSAPENTHDEINQAIEYAQRLSEAAIRVVGSSKIELNESYARNPKVVALSILCRTICNFRGALLLAQQESIIEARALVRLIYENLIWIDALRQRGAEFVKDMLNDEAFNREALAKLTLYMTAKHGGDVNDTNAVVLRNSVNEITKRFPGKKKIEAKKTAEAGVLRLAYVEYSRLSLEAVHCSITALGHHLSSESTSGKTELCLSVTPNVGPSDILTTVQGACRGLLSVVVGVNEIVGCTSEAESLAEIFTEFEQNGWL
ncbi:DUF5677 domain-containing protein [Labrys sedimenti]|uniref:DUF5677 domain-containing protein n=1 Tax=Labrys sedimenti TaxID=3106036 RepID=UPI002ACA5E3C|nr:DUF5677 domain-containing protein [Labrys sp. ZIDIC5]MDZ5448262.1 DUF5677 domain-containing protein [Labrys sp. ZIDIC5]